ncbi:unnamed protein product [Durusdinium trenchii]|uniref:Uncharacterized protein n=1 Tax=Durusdinium trenchii TaxID=1381693 RepID=A0ABP0P134_9DINO
MVLDYRRPRQDKTEVEWLSSYFKFILEHDAKNYQGRWGADERAGGPRGRVRCRSALDLFALWALANCFLRLSRRRIAGAARPAGRSQTDTVDQVRAGDGEKTTKPSLLGWRT